MNEDYDKFITSKRHVVASAGFEPLEKEISIEDMQKIVDANEKLVKEMKDGSK